MHNLKTIENRNTEKRQTENHKDVNSTSIMNAQNTAICDSKKGTRMHIVHLDNNCISSRPSLIHNGYYCIQMFSQLFCCGRFAMHARIFISYNNREATTGHRECLFLRSRCIFFSGPERWIIKYQLLLFCLLLSISLFLSLRVLGRPEQPKPFVI